MEGNILLWIQENLRSAALTPVMEFITHLGDTAGAGSASGFSAYQ